MLTTNARKKFSEVMRSLRQDRDYREFSRLTGLNHGTLIKWETDLENEPSKRNLAIIARLFGQSLDEFLDYLNSPDPVVPPTDRLAGQVQAMSNEDLSILLRAIADRLENLDNLNKN